MVFFSSCRSARAEIAHRKAVKRIIEVAELESNAFMLPSGSLPLRRAEDRRLRARARQCSPRLMLLDEPSGRTEQDEEREDLARFILRLQA